MADSTDLLTSCLRGTLFMRWVGGGGMEDIELVTSNALHMEMAWEIQ